MGCSLKSLRVSIQFSILFLIGSPLALFFQNCANYKSTGVQTSASNSVDNNSPADTLQGGETSSGSSSGGSPSDGMTSGGTTSGGSTGGVPMTDEPIPVGVAGDWQLIFEDEFDGTTLDLAIWEPSWFTGTNISPPINSDEDGCYDPAQVSVSGGYLRLTATSTAKANCRIRSGATARYASGLVNTRKSFLFAYGYTEARVYLPGANRQIHNWPAVWTNGTGPWPSTGEIDIMEGLSEHKACWHYHYLDTSGNHQGPGGCANLSDPTGWHIFAVNWQPGKLTYYYDEY